MSNTKLYKFTNTGEMICAKDFKCSFKIRSIPEALLFFNFLIVDLISFSVIREFISSLMLFVASSGA